MLSGFALIYLGGVAFVYFKLIYDAFTPPDDTRLNSDVRDDGESPIFTSINNYSTDDDSSSAEEDSRLSSNWLMETRHIPTFKRSNDNQATIPPAPAPLHRKSVRFDPISREHLTFSSLEYARKNHEWFERMKVLNGDREKMVRIYLEMEIFKTFEMEVQNMPMEAVDDEFKEEEIVENEPENDPSYPSDESEQQFVLEIEN